MMTSCDLDMVVVLNCFVSSYGLSSFSAPRAVIFLFARLSGLRAYEHVRMRTFRSKVIPLSLDFIISDDRDELARLVVALINCVLNQKRVSCGSVGW